MEPRPSKFYFHFLFIMLIMISFEDSKATTSLGVLVNLSTITSHDITTVPREAHSIVDVSSTISFKDESSFHFLVGYLYQSSTSPLTATTDQSLVMNGPYFGMTAYGYRGAVSFSLGALPYVLADYSRTTTERWLGSGYYTKFGFHPKISDDWWIDLQLTYSSQDFTSKFETGSFTTMTSFGHSSFSPMIGLHFNF